MINTADQPGQHRLEADKWDWCKSFCSPLVRNRPERVHLRSIRGRKLCWAWDLFAECFCLSYVCGETVYSGLRDGEEHLQDGLHTPPVTQARCCHVPKGFSQIRGLGQIHSVHASFIKHHKHNSEQITFGFNAGRQAFTDVKRVIKLQNKSYASSWISELNKSLNNNCDTFSSDFMCLKVKMNFDSLTKFQKLW